MTPLAYALIVVVPLIALITVAIALVPGRPAPGRTLQTPSITARIAEIDERLARQVADSDADRKRLERERRQLHTELTRRGLGRWDPQVPGR